MLGDICLTVAVILSLTIYFSSFYSEYGCVTGINYEQNELDKRVT